MVTIFYLLIALCCHSFNNTISGQSNNGCGAKYKNLIILQELLKDEADVSVPDFIVISSERIVQALRKGFPTILDNYKNLV